MEKKTISDYWEIIFDKYNVLDKIESNQVFKINANQIKKYKEPRLMTKFDSRKSRPKIFKQNNLGILPIDNGEYLIGRFELYESIPKLPNLIPLEVDLPEYLESIDPDNIYSESNALNVALLSGMIQNLIGEDLYETVSGRMRANEFDFCVRLNGCENQTISVRKPQIEIDGGYESKTKLVLVEAKNTDPEDFIIRQLYYPYRFWSMKVKKTIVPIFFTYKNGLYDFYIYDFEDKNDYNSIKFVEHISYRLRFRNLETIDRKRLEIVDEDFSIPFPQADSFTRVKGILDYLSDVECNTAEIADLFDFTPRQGSYYLAATRYLGLTQRKNNSYSLSQLGKSLNELSIKERNIMLGKLILSHKPFLLAYEYYSVNKEFPSVNQIVHFMKLSKVNNSSNNEAVYKRRASTIRGWIQWIVYSGISVK